MRHLSLGISFCFFLILIFLLSNKIFAQENQISELSQVVDILNKEIDEFYQPYVNYFDGLNQSQDKEAYLNSFPLKLSSWELVLQETSSSYKNFISSSDSNVSQIASLALSGSEKALLACEAYDKSLAADNNQDYQYYSGEGDRLVKEAADLHDSATNMYNSVSGINDQFTIRDMLIVGSVIASLFSMILFIKSRKKSLIQAEITKSTIYKNLFKTSLWMTGGLLITTVGYAHALQKGGTYYILYGPILVGGWQLLKGLSYYFREGRPTLNQLAIEEKNSAIKNSYKEETSTIIKKPIYKICPFCKSVQSPKAIVCKKCGENIL